MYDVFNRFDCEDIHGSLKYIEKECKKGLFEEIEADLQSAKERHGYEYEGIPATVIETESYWLINLHTGLGFGQYPKACFTLKEAWEDATSTLDEH